MTVKLGIPRSLFLGRVVGDGEPLWTHEDRMWVLAYDHVEKDKCSGCGFPLSETTAPDAEERFKGHVVRCHACRSVAHAAETVDDNRGLMSWAERT